MGMRRITHHPSCVEGRLRWTLSSHAWVQISNRPRRKIMSYILKQQGKGVGESPPAVEI